MGTGATKVPEYGVPVNPRVLHAANVSDKEKQGMLIDAPVLVKLNDGTVRYRYTGDEQEQRQIDNRIEKPHEGPEKRQKLGYFYHSKLNDFSKQGSAEKEEPYKLCYVYKGLEKAKQKQLYYVFGKGLKTNDQGFIKPTYDPGIQTFDRPTFYKQHGHLYFDLHFMKQEEDFDQTDEHIDDKNVDENIPDDKILPVELVINDKNSMYDLKRRLCKRFVKIVSQLHIYQHGQEFLDPDGVISKLRRENDGAWKHFTILLLPK